MLIRNRDTASMHSLRVKNLSCERHGRQLFSMLNFSVRSGEIRQIYGANGVGKTSLLNMICGLFPCDSGAILWNGRLMQRSLNDFREQSLFIGHQPGLKMALNPSENIAASCAIRGVIPKVDIEYALSSFTLSNKRVPCQQLSSGQCRRVALARLLTIPANLWILDEPFTALDQQAILQVTQMIEEHRQQSGMVLLTSHQPLQLQHVKGVQLA